MTPTMIRPDPDVPGELATAVRAAAHALPASREDLPRIRAKARTYRLRRTALHATVAVALVGLFAAAVPVVQRLDRSPPAGPAAAPPAGQRLILEGYLAGGELGKARLPKPPPDIDFTSEVTADGRARLLSRPAGLSGRPWTVPLPDGRLAMMGKPDNGSGKRLLILAPDGMVTLSRDFPDQEVGLYAASNTDVFLMRGLVFFAHDIATGAERELRRPVEGSHPRVFFAHANADRVVVFPAHEENGSCWAAILDPRTGAVVKEVNAPQDFCFPMYLQLSPDGRHLAVLAHRRSEPSITRLMIIDVATGQALRNVPIAELPREPSATWVFWGYAWASNTTLRYATAVVPAGEADKLQGALQLQTFTV